MIIYVLMGRALYCPQASKPSQNLCPMPLKYHIFISLALRAGGVESLKSPALSLCLARRAPQIWFLFESSCQRRQFSAGMRMEQQAWEEALPWGGSADLGTEFSLSTPFRAQHIPEPETGESKTCSLPWCLTSLCPEWTEKLIYWQPQNPGRFSLSL